MDTSLFVVSAGETKEDSTLVCFTESKDKDVCFHVERCTFVSPHELIISPVTYVTFIAFPVFVQKYVWRGDLNAGTYYLLPFTSGCRLKKRSKKGVSHKPVELVHRTDTGELDLSRELRWVCVCIHSNKHITKGNYS